MTTPKLDVPGRTPGLERGVSPSKVQEMEAAAELLAEPLARADVLTRVVPWDNYLSGGILTPEELALLKAYDKQSSDRQSDLLDEKGKEYVGLFFGLLRKVSTPETLQYILAMVNALVEADEERRTALLHDVARTQDVYGTLLALLRRTTADWFVCKEAAQLYTRMLCSRQCAATEEQQAGFLQWLAQQLGRETLTDVRVAVNALQRLLLVPAYRSAFARGDGGSVGGLELLQRVAETNTGSPALLQLLYETCCCIWLCLYDKAVAAAPPDGLVPALVSAIRLTQKEKVRRVCLAALRNMLSVRSNRHKMVACLLHRLVATLRQRRWGDPEIEDDIQAIDDALQQEVQAMSSWDMYRTEVASGTLEWSPVHRSEHFWRENVTRFEDDGWAVLGRLRELIRTSKDKQAVAIACFDLGEFVRFHPRGRTVLNQMNVKTDLMQLLLNEDPEVRKNALFSLQKIMAHRVEYSGV